jgi:hypothetical protein
MHFAPRLYFMLPVDPVAVEEFWKGFKKVPAALIPNPEPQRPTDTRAEPQAAKATKLASGSKGHIQTALAVCPVCETSPFHLRYRCPVVLAGSGRIRQRIAELQQNEEADHSKLIQELRGLAEKSQKANKTEDPKNVNAHSPHLRGYARKGGVSDQSVAVAGRKLAAVSGTRPDEDDSDSSSDDSDSEPLSTRSKAPPRPPSLYVDAELEAIIRGPTPSRLTFDDILFEEEEDEAVESVVLENDEDEDVNFRRRSRQLEAVVSSGEEDDDDEENFSNSEVAKSKTPPAINTSVRAASRHSSPRSATEPLEAIDGRQSVDFDPAGDIAVGDAMASDNVMFGLESPVSGNEGSTAENADSIVDSPQQSARSTPVPLTPKRTPKHDLRTPAAVEELNNLLSDRPEIAAGARGEDDPIQPAEDFPPTPVQPTKATQPVTPSTPRMVQRMKDRNGKIPVKLSQLDPPFSLSPQTQIQTQPAESVRNDTIAAGQVVNDPPAAQKTTRSSTRLASAPSMPALQVEQPAKRRRAPNKTAEQRAQEAAAKLAAKEERERLRKEKAQEKALAKAAGKNGTQHVKNVTHKQGCPPTDPAQATPPPKPPLALAPSPEGSVGLSKAALSPTAMSQDEWTVLKPTSPLEEEYREQESMRDELHSSSSSNAGDRDEAQAPLFFPAESQVPFPYSQWNSVPEFSPRSPKDSDDEEEEEEVAAAMKSPQRPANASTGSYRRLTDIASQPSLFSTRTALRAADFPPATFPSAKDKRDALYGKLPQEDDDDSDDSDSSAGNAPSHIPKSRRAGMVTRQR